MTGPSRFSTRWMGLLILIALVGCDPYREGKQLLAKGEYEKAAEYFLAQSKVKPNDPRVHHELGFAYTRLDMDGDAVKEYLKALQLKPDYFEAHLNLGSVLLKVEDLEGAAAQLHRAIELKPDSEVAHANLAHTYFYMNQLDRAKQEIQRAIELSGGKHPYAELSKMIEEQKKFAAKAAKTKAKQKPETDAPSPKK